MAIGKFGTETKVQRFFLSPPKKNPLVLLLNVTRKKISCVAQKWGKKEGRGRNDSRHSFLLLHDTRRSLLLRFPSFSLAPQPIKMSLTLSAGERGKGKEGKRTDFFHFWGATVHFSQIRWGGSSYNFPLSLAVLLQILRFFYRVLFRSFPGNLLACGQFFLSPM